MPRHSTVRHHQSATVVPITLVMRRAGPEPAQLRRWRRRHRRDCDDCANRDTGDDSAVIGSADPRPDTAYIRCSAIRSAHGDRAGGSPHGSRAGRSANRSPSVRTGRDGAARRTANGGAAGRPTDCGPASRTTVRGPAGRTTHHSPAEGVRCCCQSQGGGETESGQPVHCLTPIDCFSAAPSRSCSAPSGGSNWNSASDGWVVKFQLENSATKFGSPGSER